MLILATDTTTPSGSVALLEGETLLGEIGLESGATHSARLFRSVDFLLGVLGEKLARGLAELWKATPVDPAANRAEVKPEWL